MSKECCGNDKSPQNIKATTEVLESEDQTLEMEDKAGHVENGWLGYWMLLTALLILAIMLTLKSDFKYAGFCSESSCTG